MFVGQIAEVLKYLGMIHQEGLTNKLVKQLAADAANHQVNNTPDGHYSAGPSTTDEWSWAPSKALGRSRWFTLVLKCSWLPSKSKCTRLDQNFRPQTQPFATAAVDPRLSIYRYRYRGRGQGKLSLKSTPPLPPPSFGDACTVHSSASALPICPISSFCSHLEWALLLISPVPPLRHHVEPLRAIDCSEWALLHPAHWPLH
jgi:hypothetical protein